MLTSRAVLAGIECARGILESNESTCRICDAIVTKKCAPDLD